MKVASLKDLCLVFGDGDWIESKDQSDSGIRLIQTGNIGSGIFKDRIEKARWISDDIFRRLKCTEISEGDVLISRLPDPVGRACIIPALQHKAITAVDCSIVRFDEKVINPRYFVYYSQSPAYAAAIEPLISGSTRQRISREKLGTIQIPLPSLERQRKIVEKLDSAFAEIENARNQLRQREGSFTMLEAGLIDERLTRNFESLIKKPLKEITSKIGSGATPRGGEESYKSEGIALIRSLNVYDDGFRIKKLARIDQIQAKALSNVEVQDGDVLLNITGASIARTCLAPQEYLPARVNQHVSIIRPKPEIILSEYLHYVLRSESMKNKLLGVGNSGGSTRQALTKVDLENTIIEFPSEIEDQKRAVDELNSLGEFSHTFKVNLLKMDSLFSALASSLLSLAFNEQVS